MIEQKDGGSMIQPHLPESFPFVFPELTVQACEAAVCTAGQAPFGISEAWHCFRTDLPQFFRIVNARPEARLLYLFYYLHFTHFVHLEYQELGIPDDVFFDTFSDIGRWEKVCYEHTGAHGLEEYEWLSLHLRRELFCLGRLQFQPAYCPRDFAVPPFVKKGEPVLNVHIPSGSRLTPQLCQDSYQRALRFFTPAPAAFLCHSWLLCPELKELLPPDSNILYFQEDYTLIGIDIKSRQAEERIFGCLKADPAEYPENSSLQKAAKAWLLSGSKLPAGIGIKAPQAGRN